MQEIAMASRTQSDDIAQLHQAIDRIDGDTQQNAARVEQTASIAQSLRGQVETLLDAVGMFTLSTDAPQAAAAAPVDAPVPQANHEADDTTDDVLRSAA
jgi:predicted HAD superfamily Cof-like phosphohydrolase